MEDTEAGRIVAFVVNPTHTYQVSGMRKETKYNLPNQSMVGRLTLKQDVVSDELLNMETDFVLVRTWQTTFRLM